MLRFLVAAASGVGAGVLFGSSTVRSASFMDGSVPQKAKDYGQSDWDAVNLDVKQDVEAARRTLREQREQEAAAQGLKSAKGRGALSLKFQPFKLGEVINLTEESAIFRFLLPNADDEFYLEPCSTLQAQKKEGANAIEHLQRMYTPISPSGTKGYFDVLCKKQPGGRMTEYLWSMRPGESLNFRVVLHKLKYYPNVYDHVGLIGTGTGITSLLQVIRKSCDDANDKTRLTLLFANPSNKRVLMRGTLDELSRKTDGRFKPFYTVDAVEEEVDGQPWDGFTGYIDRAMIEKVMPAPSSKNLMLVCGSDQLLNSVCGTPMFILRPWSRGDARQPASSHGAANYSEHMGGALGELGWHSDNVYRF